MSTASFSSGPKLDWRARGHGGWWAFALHRLSGVALTLFLPLDFSLKRLFLLLQAPLLALQLASSLGIVTFQRCTKTRRFLPRFVQRLVLL